MTKLPDWLSGAAQGACPSIGRQSSPAPESLLFADDPPLERPTRLAPRPVRLPVRHCSGYFQLPYPAVRLPAFIVGRSCRLPTTKVGRDAVRQALRETEFELMFERALDSISDGRSLIEFMRDRERRDDYQGFVGWIHRDPERKRRYREAQAIGTEVIIAETFEIADGRNPDGTASLEDVQRSKLRIDTRQFAARMWNKERYGDTKQITVGGEISILHALDEAKQRALAVPRLALDEALEGEFEELSNREVG